MNEQILLSLFITVLKMSLTASVIILAVLLARILLRKAPRIFSYMLWAIVLFRLLCPVSFSSRLSLLGTLSDLGEDLGQVSNIPPEIGAQAGPQVQLQTPTLIPFAGDLLTGTFTPEATGPKDVLLFTGTGIWLAGILIFLIYSIISLYRLQKSLKPARKDSAHIYRLKGIETPFVFGLIHPRIYVPENLSSTEEHYILLHERIHIQRGDHIFRLLAWIALVIHWFNPLVWAAFVFSSRDMEMSCDEAVIRKLGYEIKKDYSSSLLSLASGTHFIKGIPLAFGEGDTSSRIKNVLHYHRPKPVIIILTAVLSIVLAVFLLANPLKKEDQVFYGIVGHTGMPEIPQLVVTIPGLGDMSIPKAELITPYIEIENFDGVEAGDFIRITFPANADVSIMEVYPARFSAVASSIEIMGRGLFELRPSGNDTYLFTIPLGMAPYAEKGATLEIYRRETYEVIASVPILDVVAEKYQIWVELPTEAVKTYLSEPGIVCRTIKAENED